MYATTRVKQRMPDQAIPTSVSSSKCCVSHGACVAFASRSPVAYLFSRPLLHMIWLNTAHIRTPLPQNYTPTTVCVLNLLGMSSGGGEHRVISLVIGEQRRRGFRQAGVPRYLRLTRKVHGDVTSVGWNPVLFSFDFFSLLVSSRLISYRLVSFVESRVPLARIRIQGAIYQVRYALTS